jgi:hypothetical protein
VGPQREGFGAEGAGNGALVARALHVLVGRHFALGHPAQVAPVLWELIWQQEFKKQLIFLLSAAVKKIFIEKLCSIIAWIILFCTIFVFKNDVQKQAYFLKYLLCESM